MFALFAALTVAWAVLLVRRRDVAHRIHLLMFALVLLKSLTLMAQVGFAWGGVTGCIHSTVARSMCLCKDQH